MASTDPIHEIYAVPSVQELIKTPILSIPDQYVVQSDHHHQDSLINIPAATIPTIDFNLLLSNQTSKMELQKLHSSCKEWGIFQLVNHGVKLEKVKDEIGGFYNLPLEEKMKYKIREGEVEGYGTVARSQGKLDWGDRFYMITNPISRRKPHLLPQLPPSLRNNLESYISELQELSKKLLGFIAEGLKMDEKEMEEMFEDGMQSMRMTYYPPCPKPELVVGITPHSDATGITILNQINGVDGLQVKKDGVWLPVSFLPHSLVVNVGDILEILSNGVYHSIEHKARVNSEKERISIAFFVNPRFEAEVGPASSLTNPQNPPVYRRIGMENYVKDFFTRKLKGKSYLEYMKIN
ncbi:oxoglutarate-dependent flavonoid 7-O-demethylase 1-like [Euphorbia lathyris]|uniref:oxoglutarate-dependent flavonoid 7-O-demethylase 1-like n=1 Tax=Euphorbia lathyris TaxID=212925 RepID=UPI003313D508